MEEQNKIIKINGVKEVEEMKFHDIEGGFGENKKAMLVKEIANIHNQPFGEINRRINDNIKRFKENVDIIDIKANGFEPLGVQLGFTKQSFNQTKNIYILSERGYSKLLKILEDDFAWEQYEKLVDGYFNMKKEIKDKNDEMKLIVQDMFNGFNTLIINFENKINDRFDKLEQKQEELEDYYKPTHKKKLGINGFIKSCLGDNATKDNVGKATEQLLFLLGGFEQYQEVPKDILENMSTKTLVYDICKNINLSINKGIEIK